MKSFRRLLVLTGLCLVSAGWFWMSAASTQAAPEEAPAAAPVESDMHEFMEYVYEPAYKRLKASMATAPENNQGWKAIKGDALTLAEAGNLLLIRQPKEDAADWAKHSQLTRESGAALYQAAKAKDYATARKQYETLLIRCNACHDQFAEGEHQLTP